MQIDYNEFNYLISKCQDMSNLLMHCKTKITSLMSENEYSQIKDISPTYYMKLSLKLKFIKTKINITQNLLNKIIDFCKYLITMYEDADGRLANAADLFRDSTKFINSNLLLTGRGAAGFVTSAYLQDLNNGLNKNGLSYIDIFTDLKDEQYQTIINNALILSSALGLSVKCYLGESFTTESEKLLRIKKHSREVRPEIKDKYLTPHNLEELIYNFELVNRIGGDDEMAMRIISKTDEYGNVISMTVIMPPTHGFETPNSWQQDGGLMVDNAPILENAKLAIEKEFAKLGMVDGKDIPIMIGGFSQGGLAAAAFSQKYQNDFNISQVVTVGSPIGIFSGIPKSTNVIAFEFDDDIVPKLDLTKNPIANNWETIKIDNGKYGVPGGFNYFGDTDDRRKYADANPLTAGQAHNAGKYADAAASDMYAAKNPNNTNEFFSNRGDGSDMLISDYFMH
ncbi:MAG: hypothetical protein LBN03_02225 [Bifidobacteriaceae bacterium]|jgi:hypothetical protein|nr:hypothetical protein [Bifidobacteriaceae bacterium]